MVTLTRRGRSFIGLCPFHNEKSPSFSVNPDKQFYYCFGCGASGNALTFLMEHDNLEFVEAVETLARMQGVQVQREERQGYQRSEQQQQQQNQQEKGNENTPQKQEQNNQQKQQPNQQDKQQTEQYLNLAKQAEKRALEKLNGIRPRQKMLEKNW